ncbi:hypothetical protein AVEN_206920-1 [Araneus ventricosus]|uniref:Uncharacterized protein n=1 Tax=Araneus ventricosus TaxID=182803 RepID=A0A4Y2RGI8_ARAVE|nr:hypothetical protein AVEN_206920-1 [Araneus ventricosus]
MWRERGIKIWPDGGTTSPDSPSMLPLLRAQRKQLYEQLLAESFFLFVANLSREPNPVGLSDKLKRLSVVLCSPRITPPPHTESASYTPSGGLV